MPGVVVSRAAEGRGVPLSFFGILVRYLSIYIDIHHQGGILTLANGERP